MPHLRECAPSRRGLVLKQSSEWRPQHPFLQSPDALGLDLSNSFARDGEANTNFLESLRRSLINSKPPPQDVRRSRLQFGQQPVHSFGD